MISFIKEHKRLMIGFFIYSGIFILTRFVDIWSGGVNITKAEEGIFFTNAFIEKIPLDFFYYGIDELVRAEAFIMEKVGNDMQGIFFFISVCAFFGYNIVIKKVFLLDEDELAIPETMLIDYFYENIGIFISSLVVKLLYLPVSNQISTIWTEHANTTFGNILIRAGMVLAIILLIIVPSLPNVLYIGGYLFCIGKIVKLANYMEKSIPYSEGVKTGLIFITIVVLLALLNMIMGKLLEYIQEAVLARIVEVTEEGIGMVCSLVFLVIKCIAVLAVIGGVIFVIQKVKGA